MDDVFGTAKSWNEYLDLLHEYDLLHDSPTVDIDFPFLDCEAVFNSIMNTQRTYCKSSLDPAIQNVSPVLANVVTIENVSSWPVQKTESIATSQSVLCYSSQVSLERIDSNHRSQAAVFDVANQARDDQDCRKHQSHADSSCRGNKIAYMLECTQPFKQTKSIKGTPNSLSHSSISVTVKDHRTANFASVPCRREVSFIFTEAKEMKELAATNNMLEINKTVPPKECHHKKRNSPYRTSRRKCKRLERLRKDLTKLQHENANLQRVYANLHNSSAHDQAMWYTSRQLMHTMFCSRQAFLVTDPHLADNGIVYASPAFLHMTGYAREQQILGRSCRFLQGPRTCPSKINELRKAIEQGEEWVGTIVNYKADNTPFWNRLLVVALRDSDHTIVNYIGLAVEVELPDTDDPEYEQALADVDGR